MKKVLITGGAGFIGSHLALALERRGYQVRILDNLHEQVHGKAGNSQLFETIQHRFEFIEGDVRDAARVEKSIHGQDIVIHFAAETGTGQSMEEYERYADVNVRGTGVLLDTIRAAKKRISKIMIASSRAVYGEGSYHCLEHGKVYPGMRNASRMDLGLFNCICPHCHEEVSPEPTDEDARLNPRSFYGITKLAQEQMILNFGLSTGIPAIALRYQNVYGPKQSLINPYTGILAIFSSRLKAGEELNIFEDGKESRDFIFIDDAVSATILGLENETSGEGVFNVGTSVPVSIETLAGELKKKLGSDSPLRISGDYRPGDIRHNYAETSRIQEKLGFNPTHDFESGLELYARWFKTTG